MGPVEPKREGEILPPEILEMICYHVDDPKTFKSICKLWSEIQRGLHEGILSQAKRHSFFSRFTKDIKEELSTSGRVQTVIHRANAYLFPMQRFQKKPLSSAAQLKRLLNPEGSLDPRIIDMVILVNDSKEEKEAIELVRFFNKLCEKKRCNQDWLLLPEEKSIPETLTPLETAKRIRQAFLAHSEQLSTIKTIDIDHCDLTALPPEISLFKNLEYISCVGNQLTTLPKELKGLKKMQEVSVADNPLKPLPKELLTPSFIVSIDPKQQRILKLGGGSFLVADKQFLKNTNEDKYTDDYLEETLEYRKEQFRLEEPG